MTNPIFGIVNGKPKITDHTRTLWLYKDIIDKYGENIACKIFIIYHYMADMSLDNPFKDISELEKLETIIRAVAPEITLEVDWNDLTILEGIEFTRKLYETGTYRIYLASKTLLDKLTYQIQTTYVNLSKEFGNSGEIDKAYKVFETTSEKTKKMYSDYLEEQGTIRVRGQGLKTISKISKNVKKELD